MAHRFTIPNPRLLFDFTISTLFFSRKNACFLKNPMPTVSRKKPLISVVMPVYNSEHYVGEAIESILRQTYSSLELIIVDDGSKDGSRKVIEEFARREGRIRFIPSDHQGTSEAHNKGIALAEGAFIAHMDSDDIALPERLEVQWDWMQRTGIDICGSCVQYMGDRKGILWFPQDHNGIQAELFFRSALLPSAVMMRAPVLKENLHAPGVIFHDYELWTRLAPHYRMGNVQRVLVQYRTHQKQTSRLTAAAVREDLQKYRRRYFSDLFPETTRKDIEAFERLANEQPHETVADLELAASWLIRSGSSSDSFVQNRMAARWAGACCRSAGLGMECLAIYRKFAAQLGSIDSRTLQKLRILCFIRQGSNSRIYQTAKRLSSRYYNQDHASA